MKIISPKEAKERGLVRYYTGKPCVHGHISERYVSSSGCATCIVEREKRFCADPDYARKRQEARTARQAARMARYKKDPEFYQKYCEYLRNYNKNRRLNDPAFVKTKYEKARKWFKENPNAARTYAARRRSLLAKSKTHHTKEDIAESLLRQRGKCAECENKLANGRYHVDHIVPVSLGGSNEKTNIQCLCPTCNMTKSNKHPLVWAREKGRLL